MAITMMTSKEHAEEVGYKNIKVVTDYPGAQVGLVQHFCDKCPKANIHDLGGALSEGCCSGSTYKDGVRVSGPSCGKSYCSGCHVITEPLYMETTHIGVVLDTGEINGRDDSDFYAVVWDDEAGCTKRVTYASTRGWTYPNSASVDATPEVLAKYDAWCEKRRLEYITAQSKKEAYTPSRGKRIRVVKGRKVEHGVEGEVFWVGPCKWNRNASRVGVQLTNGDKVFIDAANVVVLLTPEQEAELA